ncbi:NAD(P)H-hydrate dehydratase [Massilia sp. PAMC28688]|uniref:NAD(P)H-hydrate dehydratase n=1 Tax=Massilia sp. PAMC28688 TaxID=2861283 RepID=UPI001C62A1D2|nr:NAD(P)H-hydrate dehydratase [Massilia sp. PAMC28688]QYF93169.1 NAD(P)H-hydrate dehydratase [Massilia sp. PAMC28688]
MRPLYSVAEIRAIEQAAAASLPPGTLMQRAGQAASNLAADMAAGGPVLVLAGPGNNGGDALEAAANLALLGRAVTVIHCAGGGQVSAETAQALARARAGHVQFAQEMDCGGQWALVIDGLFGIGLARPLEGRARELALAVNALDCQVLALDVPSGLDADTGAVIGPDGVAIVASHTITFIGDKPGLHTFAGRDHAALVTVAALDIDPALLPSTATHLNEPALFAHACQARRHDSHKGSFGDVAVLGGAQGMGGAAVLAARGALYGGAGRVMVAALGPAPAYDSMQPEIMFRTAAEVNFSGCTVVAGCGMGAGASAIGLLAKVLDGAGPAVLDADAINLVGASPDLLGRASARVGPTIVTPHPLEAARLLGVTAPVVQADRLAAAREIAARMHAVVVLKGSGSVIADAGGRAVINGTGNPGLATGGTGDVLAGLCGSLLAQGWPAWEAALGAVWIHGQAADDLVAGGTGPVGLTAGELPAAMRKVLNRLLR